MSTPSVTSPTPAPIARRPVIGLLGGIASGKSFYAHLFSQAGALVIDADELVSRIYQQPDILHTLQTWWSPDVVTPDGKLNRPAVARIIFNQPAERARLEALIHPRVREMRDRIMADAMALKVPPRAFVWDIPLLIDTGQHTQCDTLVWVETPQAVREARALKRGWDPSQLAKRESAQTPLDIKRSMAHHILDGQADEATARRAVLDILAKLAPLS